MIQTVAGADYEQLLDRYSTMLFRIAFARTQSRSDAEDIVQETWVRYFRAAPELESEEHRKAWLLRVCINCANSFLTSAWRRHSAPLDETIPSGGSPESDRLDVLAAVRALPDKYRTVVHLFYYEELSVREIAEIVCAREAAVKTQLHRARQMLKEKLGGEYDDL